MKREQGYYFARLKGGSLQPYYYNSDGWYSFTTHLFYGEDKFESINEKMLDQPKQ